METVQLTKEEFAVIKEALEITERATLSEGIKSVSSTGKLEKFLKAFNKSLENDPKAKLIVAPISASDLSKLKKLNIVTTVAIVSAAVGATIATGGLASTATTTMAGGAIAGAGATGGINNAVLKQLEKNKEILKVSLINGDGSPGKIKVAAYTGGKTKFVKDAKLFPAGKRIK